VGGILAQSDVRRVLERALIGRIFGKEVREQGLCGAWVLSIAGDDPLPGVSVEVHRRYC
jgi:hypothetical protein